MVYNNIKYMENYAMTKVAVGCDHGGYVLKDSVISTLKELGAQVVDFGCDSADVSVDYPEYGYKVAKAVQCGECDLGVVMCGTGIGISIVANKVKGIRAGLATNAFMAKATREHNNANVLALGGRVVSPSEAREIVKAWYTASFEGGRHQRRIDLISQIEGDNYD